MYLCLWHIILCCGLFQFTKAKLVLQEKLDGLGAQVKTVDVQAVEGMEAKFPCDLDSNSNDKVYMVFWFRDDAGIPLYSFDVRGKPLSEARHWSAPEVFGPRATFEPSPAPASLVVRDVKRRDEGVYRCRVDFRNTQTMSFRYNLTIVVPPEPPVVVDRWGRVLNTTQLGPKEEGDDVMLTCRVLGGRPEPTVRWLVNGVLVDEEYEHNTGDVIENRLVWPAISRADYGAIFTCQAANSGLVDPREASLILDMHLRPLTVEITNKQTPLVADKRYEIFCTSAGCRPNAVITWYKGKKQLKRTKDENRENVTISELSFVPTTDDDNKPITCRAENPNVTGLFLETSWTLEVVYPPQVTLRLGSTLSADDIKEGDDVYFECHVNANPAWRKLSWMHNGVSLAHNATARIIRSNQSLVLQRVTRHSGGRYSCSALNAEGETVSNDLHFRVKYAPSCRQPGVAVVGASRGETVVIVCEVDADPPARTFKWKFNNSGETLDVAADRYTYNGSASFFKYTPVADLDYGTLSCSASNEIGSQYTPCVFQMVAAGKPHPVRNCSLSNQTTNSVEVYCVAGFDGGLPQHFILEVFSSFSEDPRFNMTSEDPVFFVANLEPDVTFRLKIFAVNSKGRGPAMLLEDILFRDAEKRTASDSELAISPLIGGVVGTLCTLIGVACALGVRARRAARAASGAPSGADEKLWPTPTPGPTLRTPKAAAPIDASQQLLRESITAAPVDDREPDVIPANYNDGAAGFMRPVVSAPSAASSPVAWAASAHHLPSQMINGPGSSWTWSARPKDLHIGQGRIDSSLRTSSSTLGRSINECGSRTTLLTARIPPGVSSSHSRQHVVADFGITSPHLSDSVTLNVEAIKEKILDNRIPESCV